MVAGAASERTRSKGPAARSRGADLGVVEVAADEEEVRRPAGAGEVLEVDGGEEALPPEALEDPEAPGAGGGADVEDARALLDEAEFLVDLHELVDRASGIAFLLGLLGPEIGLFVAGHELASMARPRPTRIVYWTGGEAVEGQTFVEAEIWTVAQTDQGNVVLVRPKGSDLAVPIFIGQLETQSILIGMGGVEVPRPLTHDLILSIDRGPQGRAACASRSTTSARGPSTRGSFSGSRAGRFVVDARPSDAIGMAVRAALPRLHRRERRRGGGDLGQPRRRASRTRPSRSRARKRRRPSRPGRHRARLERGRAGRLRAELEKAVAEEDYERAAAIRDKIRELEE